MEKLSDYGLMRPTLIKDLLDVRNLIEHEDAAPADVSKCSYYIDIVWYFLKSTDQVASMVTESIGYWSPDDKSHVSLTIDPRKKWAINISASVLGTHVVDVQGDGVLVVVGAKVKRQAKPKGFVQFRGKLIPNAPQLKRIAQDYFSAGSFGYANA
jgi:hypothetical protein